MPSPTIPLTISLTDEQAAHLQALAQERGMDLPTFLAFALIERTQKMKAVRGEQETDAALDGQDEQSEQGEQIQTPEEARKQVAH